MIIRAERAGEEEAIGRLITAAFLDAEHRDGTEAEIVYRLRAAHALTVSLVAEIEGDLAGHVAFSAVTIDGEDAGWFGLGPLAVDPRHRRRGVGAALVSEGLERLKRQGARGCVVLGDPTYYRRFGFAADQALWLANVLPAFFMVLSFGREPAAGEITYHRAFAV